MFADLGLFDILCLGVALLSCLIGMWRGFAFEVLSLAAWAGAFFAAQWGSAMIEPFWPQQWLAGNARARSGRPAGKGQKLVKFKVFRPSERVR